MDVDLLESCTEYSLCSREDPHISAFWDVLRSFSPKEKSLFLRSDFLGQGVAPEAAVYAQLYTDTFAYFSHIMPFCSILPSSSAPL